MDTSIIGLIVIAAIGVVLLVAAVGWMMLVKARQDPPTIREDASEEARALREQVALADQIFADGRRAAKADADADAAHAVRVRRQLDGHSTGTADVMTDRPGHRPIET